MVCFCSIKENSFLRALHPYVVVTKKWLPMRKQQDKEQVAFGSGIL